MHFGRNCSIAGVLRPYVKDVLAGSDLIDDIIEFDPKSASVNVRHGAVVRTLRQRKFDIAMLLPNSVRAAVLAWMAGIPERIGYARYGRSPLLTKSLQPLRDGWKPTPVSAIDYYLSLARLIGVPVHSRALELELTPADVSHADTIWNRYQLHGRRVIAFNTGGAYGSAKRWPDEHFAQLAQRLTARANTRVVVICGPAERAAAANIERLADRSSVISLSREHPSLGLSKAVIRRCDMLISTDSGPRFFGDAFGVPTITIFGPTDPRWSETGSHFSIAVSETVPCGPCAKRSCPLGHHLCMRQLKVDRILAAVQGLLEQVEFRKAG
jgi:heptosyltransferase-2